MQRLAILAPLRLNAGAVLELTPAQALPRSAELRPIGDGIYEVHGSVQFKAGEVIGYAGEVPKQLASALAVPPSQASAHAPSADVRPPGARRQRAALAASPAATE